MYFSIPFLTNPGASITTGIFVAFIPHIRSISSLYFDSFTVTFTEVFLSFRMVTSLSKRLFSFFVFEDNTWSVGPYLMVCLY